MDYLPDIRAAMAGPEGRALLLDLAARVGRPLKHATTGGGASESPGDRGLCVRRRKDGTWVWEDRKGALTSPGGKTGGDAIDLWQTIHGGTKAEAIRAVAAALGLTATHGPQRAAVLASIRANAEAQAAKAAQAATDKAADSARRIASVLDRGRERHAEAAAFAYLTRTRKIPQPPEGWPASILWQNRTDPTHPDHQARKGGAHPFILYLAQDPGGRVVAIQRAALTRAGDLAWSAKEGKRKTWGEASAGVVWIRNPEDATALALTEGVEDGLALAHLARTAGVSLAVAAALGTANAAKIAEAWARAGTPHGLPFLAAFDRDAAGAKAARVSARAFFEQARPALSCLPPPALGVKDWNEAIGNPGAPGIVGDAIRRRLARLAKMAAAYQDRRRGAPGFPVARELAEYEAQMAAATGTLRGEIAAFFRQARAWEITQAAPGTPSTKPPARLIQATLGGGKTAATMEILAHWAATWRSPEGGHLRALYLLPTFRMAQEAYATFRKAAQRTGIFIPAALIGGRAQPNIFHPQGPMNGALCVQPRTASALGGGHGDTRQSVRAQLCPGCPAFQACQTRHGVTATDPGTPGGYLAQGDILAQMARTGGVVFATTDYLHSDLPGPAPAKTEGAAASTFTSAFHPQVTILDERAERSIRGSVLGPREWARLGEGEPFDPATGAPLHHDPAPRAAWMMATGWNPQDPDASPNPPMADGSAHARQAQRAAVGEHLAAIRGDLGRLRAILEAEGPTPATPGASRTIGTDARRNALALFAEGKPLHFFRRAVASLEERDPKAPTISASADATADERQAANLTEYAEARGIDAWRAFQRFRAALERAETADRQRAEGKAPGTPGHDPRAWVEIVTARPRAGMPSVPCAILRTAEIRLDKAGGALWQRVRKAPILALDATGDAKILAATLGRPVETIAIDFPRHPGTALDGDPGAGWSKRRTFEKPAHGETSRTISKEGRRTAARLAGYVADVQARTGGRVAIIGTKEQTAHLWAPEMEAYGLDVVPGHFRAIRGSNDWEACTAAVIVGVEIGKAGGLGLAEVKGADHLGPFISGPLGIEPEARALAAALGRRFTPADPEDWGRAWACMGPAEANRAAIFEAKGAGRPRRYLWSTWRHFLDGSRVRFLEPRHPDPLGRAVLWQTIHAEIIQALHRVRQVRHPRHLAALNGLALPEHYARDLGSVATWAYKAPARKPDADEAAAPGEAAAA